MTILGHTRRMGKTATLAALLACAAAGGSAARAQAPAAPGTEPGVRTVFTSKTEFRLPVQIDERVRPGIREVSLYVRQMPGEWMRKETAPPTRDYFSYRASEDGEYWFSVATIDKQNRSTPPDVQRERPGLIVIVDTQPPIIELQPLPGSSGEAYVRCTLQDRNPDYASLKLTYRDSEQRTRLLEAIPNNPGVFRLSSSELQAGSINVFAKDRAGNVATKEFAMRDLLPPVLPSAANTSQLPPYRDPAAPPRDLVQPPASTEPKLDFTKKNPEDTGGPKLPPSLGGTPSTLPTPPNGLDVPKQPALPSTLPATMQRKILNTTHASLDYRIDQVGPSGVARVEVWLTADQGTTWQKLCEDADRRSPAEFDLPGEGLFGLRLVVTNGNGFGGTPPAKGDSPHCWVEVDTTSPNVQVRDIDPVTNGSTIDIRWTAADKNLSADPVNLYFANRREGPWTLVARNVKNDGMYRWAFPRDAGAQFFFRVEVSDQAGNVSRAETAAPVVLDMAEPRALVVGISGVGAPPPR